MKLGIMQPYFFPYIGYFQLIQAVDQFFIYDNIKYTKKGWINRNRILSGGADALITLPVKAGTDAADVRDREVAAEFRRDKLLNRIREAYRRAPEFDTAYPLVERVIGCKSVNLYDYLRYSIEEVCGFLRIETPLSPSSQFEVGPTLRGQDRVIALCRRAGADTYINSIGGIDLYSKSAFGAAGVALAFLRPRAFEYDQFGEPFVPWLSIIDVMMFNPLDAIRACLESNYDIL